VNDSRYPFPSYPESPIQRRTSNVLDLAANPLPNRGGASVAPGSMSPGMFPAGARGPMGSGLTGRFMAIPFLAGVAPITLVPEQPERFYLILINNSAANRIFVGFDYEPSATSGVILETNLGFYEPWIVPTNSVVVTAAGANTAGICLIATVPASGL
jgi:hypothetical protein